MPHLTENARLWLERAEIDYLGPFVKAWAAFNAWYRHASGSRRDAEGLAYVKNQINPVRSGIKPLLRPRELDEHGDAHPDSEDARQLKTLIRNLHACLDNYHVEIMRNDSVERISFRTVCLSSGPHLPRRLHYRRHEYVVQRQSGHWVSLVLRRTDGHPVERIEQPIFDPTMLQTDAAYQRLSHEQRSRLLALYNECNPRPLTDLLSGNGGPIMAGDVAFRCSDDQLFAGLVEIIYAMRNALLHGELQPNEQAFYGYEQAYRIILRFLECLRN